VTHKHRYPTLTVQDWIWSLGCESQEMNSLFHLDYLGYGKTSNYLTKSDSFDLRGLNTPMQLWIQFLPSFSETGSRGSNGWRSGDLTTRGPR